MSVAMTEDARHQQVSSRLSKWGQEHVFRWWPGLDATQRESLLQQLERIDFDLLKRLYEQAEKPPAWTPAAVKPAPILRLPESFEDWEREQKASEVGERALKAGQVAVLMVAGGQGTRLGYDGPKGTYAIGPISKKSLFQIHAEKVLALGRRYQSPLPFYIMTSPDNDAATRAFFEEHAYFGLERGQVVFFQQGTMPALDRRTGKLLLAATGQIATSPNGHGGVLQSLAEGGHLTALSRRGIRYLFYYQVDNPLVKVADPVYLGHHIQAGAEISSKVVSKLGPKERVGNVVMADGRMQVIEYSDLPDDLAQRRLADGSLEIWGGSIAVHVFDVAFLQRLAKERQMLPYHRAVKPVPYLDDSGTPVKPVEANAYKFEMFIFDAIPLAGKALAVETSRREEFEPLKNAEGENSPASVRQALADLFADWLNRAGVSVARRADGSAAVPLEISPLFALDAEELRAKFQQAEPIAEPLYLEAT